MVTAEGAKFSEMDRHLASIHTSNAPSTWCSKCVGDDDDGSAIGRMSVPSSFPAARII